MRSVQKIALSLLISVVAFTLFALFAFSGFFSFIESNFYDTRVRQEITQHLQSADTALSQYRKQYFDRFKTIVEDNAAKRINNVNQSAQDIFNRKNLFDKLLANNPGILFVRFIDTHGNIHFSTHGPDVLQANQYQTVYKTLAGADPNAVYAKELQSASGGDAVYIDGKNNRLLFRVPWTDYVGETVGSAVFYISLDDVQNFLIRQGVLDPGQTLSAIGNAGFAFGVPIGGGDSLSQEVISAWGTTSGSGGQGIPIAANTGGEKLFLFFRTVPSFGKIADLVPQSQFTLNKTLQLILSVSLFLTVFLLIFLLLSLRQDKLLVLADRIKRFQISFLKEYLESKSTLDWARWHSELELRRNEVKREIKKGIGKVSKDREATVDGLIDKSWDEILSVIGKRVDEEPAPMREVKGLEDAIRRLLASGELATAAARGIPGPAAAPRAPVPAPTGGGEERPTAAPTDVEEPGELEEPEELEEVEELQEVDEVAGGGGEAAETVPEVESLDEAEEPEELEEVEAIEELERPAEAVERVPPVAEEATGRPLEAGTSAEREEPEELEEVEELEEAEPVEEKAAILEPEPEGSVGAEEAEEVEEVEELEEVEAAPEAEVPAVPEFDEEPTGAAEGEEIEELAEVEELEEAEAGLEDTIQVGSGTQDELENVEALDLEAIFHGDELMADIDIFDDVEEEVEEIEEVEEVESVPEELSEELEVTGAGSPETESSERLTSVDIGATTVSGADSALVKDDEEYEGFEELDELEEVEPLEVTNPEIVQELAEEEEELETIEMLEPAEVVEIGAASEVNLQQVSYSFSFFKEFSVSRQPPARDLPGQDSLGDLMEVDESEHGMNSDANNGMNQDDAGRNPHGSDVTEGVERSEPLGEPEAGEETGGSDSIEETDGAEEPEEMEALEEVEELEEVEPVEELEELDEEVPGGQAPPPVGADLEQDKLSPFEKRIRELIGYKKIEVYSLSDVKTMGLVPEEAIEVSDGVFKIREEVVARTRKQDDEELKSLVDSVVSGGIETPEIGQVLSIPTVELSFEGLPAVPEEREDRLRAEARRKRGTRVMLTQDGFDYDSFKAQFRASNIGVMKSLMRISQKADAIYAAILVPKNGGLVAEYSLGLDEKSAHTFRFGAGDAVLVNLFSKKNLIYIRISKTGIKEFDEKIADHDLRFMKGTIYLPVIFDGKPAYLFFGLKNAELSIHDYMLKIIAE